MEKTYEQIPLFILEQPRAFFRVKVVVLRKNDTSYVQEVYVDPKDTDPMQAVKRYSKMLGSNYKIIDWWTL